MEGVDDANTKGTKVVLADSRISRTFLCLTPLVSYESLAGQAVPCTESLLYSNLGYKSWYWDVIEKFR